MLALLALPLAIALPPFELKDGDRVVWIGSAIAEREQKYGHWETALLCQWPDRKITVRNLGWSGDTVEGIARASFDPPAKGYERLIAAVKKEKPTVIFVSYGSVEALTLDFKNVRKGDLGTLQSVKAGDFSKKLTQLLEALSDTKARVILFTPTPLEGKENPEGQENIALLAGAIRDFENQGYRVADLHKLLSEHTSRSKEKYSFTDNGIHFNDAGYEGTIPDLMSALGLSWGGESPQKYEAVRKAVVKKNELFFNQWRPQNETYLFGFRKHEQGKNAKEVDEFNALIANAESEISKALKAK